MSSSSGDSDVGPLIADLVRTLRRIETEFEPRTEHGFPRPPTPSELLRFSSDVAIPATILVLRTNIEALKLLQRALRMADGRPPTSDSNTSNVRKHAARVSTTTLSRLDDALRDLQDAVEGRPTDESTRELLDEARGLRDDVEEKLNQQKNGSSTGLDEETADVVGGTLDSNEAGENGDGTADSDTSVPVDVDAELRSIKDEFDGGDDDDTPRPDDPKNE